MQLLSLSQNLGQFGPLRCKEIYALDKLSRQANVIEHLIKTARMFPGQIRDLQAGMYWLELHKPALSWGRIHERSQVSNLRFFLDLRPFAQLGFTKDLRLRFFSDLVSNLRLPRG